LMRLLAPRDFGLLSMALVFIGVLEAIAELGFTAALIQRQQQDLREEHWDMAFWVALGAGGGAWLITLVGLGPFVAWLYGEVELRAVLPVLALGLDRGGCSVVSRSDHLGRGRLWGVGAGCQGAQLITPANWGLVVVLSMDPPPSVVRLGVQGCVWFWGLCSG
jgi:hypothetical protein